MLTLEQISSQLVASVPATFGSAFLACLARPKLPGSFFRLARFARQPLLLASLSFQLLLILETRGAGLTIETGRLVTIDRELVTHGQGGQ